MGTHPYDYDARIPWRSPQNQYYEKVPLAAYWDQQQLPQRMDRIPGQRVEAMKRVPGECVLALAQELKRWFVVSSLVGFDTFSGLATVQQIEAEVTGATQSSSDSSQSAFSPQSSLFEHNDFFYQQGGDNFGSRNTASAPITGSGVS